MTDGPVGSSHDACIRVYFERVALAHRDGRGVNHDVAVWGTALAVLVAGECLDLDARDPYVPWHV